MLVGQMMNLPLTIATFAWNDYRHFELYYAMEENTASALCYTLGTTGKISKKDLRTQFAGCEAS